MSQKTDPVSESSLQKGQDEGKCSKNVVSTVVHETAEETELLTGSLHFHQIIQSGGNTQILKLKQNNGNLSKLATRSKGFTNKTGNYGALTDRHCRKS